MEDTQTVYKDKIGRPINIGDLVTYINYNQLCIGKIIKATPKMVRIQSISGRNETVKYPSEILVIDQTEYLTLYLLTK